MVESSWEQWDALHQAAADGSVEELQRILKETIDIDINTLDDNDRTALMLAVIRDDAEGEKKAIALLERGRRRRPNCRRANDRRCPSRTPTDPLPPGLRARCVSLCPLSSRLYTTSSPRVSPGGRKMSKC